MEQQALGHLRILIIDDQLVKVKLVAHLLRVGGFSLLQAETDPTRAVEVFSSFKPDLVILDLHMSPKDGFQLLREFRSMLSPSVYLPVLVLTGDATKETKENVLSAGAHDFLAKPFNGAEIVLRVRNLLRTRHLYLQLENERSQLEQRVQERTKELTLAHSEMLDRLALITDYRDDCTGEHTKRVSGLVTMLALELGVEPHEAELYGKAALLHDLGKICIPDSILLKPESLSPSEFERIKTHTRVGGEILKNSCSVFLKVAETIARFHHERWNGTGYEGLKGLDIPLEARISALADTFDAPRASRPYKYGWKHECAVAEIERLSGSHFDPDIVAAFLRIEKELIPLYENSRELLAA